MKSRFNSLDLIPQTLRKVIVNELLMVHTSPLDVTYVCPIFEQCSVGWEKSQLRHFRVVVQVAEVHTDDHSP